LERFPAYAPDLNPDEGLWAQLKETLANGRPDDIDELESHLLDACEELSRSQPAWRACIHRSELPSFFP